LPANAQEVDLTFGTQLQSFNMARIATWKDQEVILQLPTIGGRLVLEPSPHGNDAMDRIFVLHNGAAESALFLRAYLSPQETAQGDQESGSISLAPLSAGDYFACFEVTWRMEQHPPEAECVRGTMAAGGELLLRASDRGP
jgi:hypothetical protein